jgi:hypothetical protein
VTLREAIREHERGMTLLEILVGLGALMLVGFIAVQLVIESQRWYVLAAREMHNPETQLVERRIAADASVSTLAFPGGIGDELTCFIPGLGTADYRLDGGKLVRKWTDLGGVESPDLTMLEDTSAFQWSWLGPRLIQVVIVHRPRARPSVWSAGVPLWARTETGVETLTFPVVIRLR